VFFLVKMPRITFRKSFLFHFRAKLFQPGLFNPRLSIFNPELFNPGLSTPNFSTPEFSTPNFSTPDFSNPDFSIYDHTNFFSKNFGGQRLITKKLWNGPIMFGFSHSLRFNPATTFNSYSSGNLTTYVQKHYVSLTVYAIFKHTLACIPNQK
jgi:hypothetical protein